MFLKIISKSSFISCYYLLIICFNSLIFSFPINNDNLTNKPDLLKKLHKFENKEKEEIVNNLKANNLSDIEPVNHLEVLPIQADGNINKDLHKELFLANHDDLEDLDEKIVAQKLTDIFKKADINRNNVLNAEEIENWILRQVNIHLDDAINKNNKMFEYMDTDKNNLLFWDEYYAIYEKLHGMDNSSDKEPRDLDAIKRELGLIRDRWMNSDTNNDDALNVDEFLTFRHPETNGASLRKLTQGLMSSMDRNNDGYLSLQEFLYLSSDVNTDDEERAFLKDRKEEFFSIDRDQNNLLDLKELQDYLNPHNPRLIKSHVKQIFDFVDNDRNNVIDLNEMLQNIRFFIDNKFVDAGDFVHDDL